MRYKAIEKLSHAPITKNGLYISVLFLGTTFILDFWQNGYKTGRYAMNSETGEYASQHHGTTWTNRGLIWFFEINPGSHGYYHYHSNEKDLMKFASRNEEKQLKELIRFEENKRPYSQKTIYDRITHMETEYNVSRRETTSRNHFARVDAMMERIPQRPDDLEEWIDKLAAGGVNYLIKYSENKLTKNSVEHDEGYSCTACGRQSTEEEVTKANKALPKNRTECRCPKCKEAVIMAKRGVRDVRTRFYLMQDIDSDISVNRHFQVHINYPIGTHKRVWLSEATRFVMFRGFQGCRGTSWELYYNQIPAYQNGGFFTGDKSWDTKKSWGNRYMSTGYLYPGNIAEALTGTEYEPWTKTFTAASQKSIFADYNQLMSSAEPALPDICELLIKGRFLRLFKETSHHVSVWSGAYTGPLDISGYGIEDVFGIADRQLINRLREKDGGELALEWLQLSEQTGKKLSDALLTWVIDNSIRVDNASEALERLSPEALMNYIIRQKREQYQDKRDSTVLGQYIDYLKMAAKEGKDLTDAMVYKPRELKRRHDELVAEINKREMIEQMKRDKAAMKKKAKEYRERFPGAEENLREISPRFTWKDDDYIFIVPKSLLEIVTEGQALHHCVGATDRYFDRIVQRETFIVFLRKTSEPKVPYYTIEVEPGGTVRQHRGAFDEEPDIEKIKPHIRAWQAHIRKGMTKKDHADAKVAKKKREENIEQLKRDRNTRVLSGLLEDFMEAM